MLGCSLAIAGAVVVILATCGYTLVSHGIEAKRINDQNIATTRTIVEALAIHRKNRVYPPSLCDLHLAARPPFAEGTQILFKSFADGASYWLALMDINDAEAKYDARWADGCR